MFPQIECIDSHYIEVLAVLPIAITQTIPASPLFSLELENKLDLIINFVF